MKRKIVLLLLVAALLAASVGIGYAIGAPEPFSGKTAATVPEEPVTEPTTPETIPSTEATKPVQHIVLPSTPEEAWKLFADKPNDVRYYYALYGTFEETKEELKVPVYNEQSICYNTGSMNFTLWWRNSFRTSNANYPQVRSLLTLAPTTALRVRADNTGYAVYDTDTGYRLYLFLDPKENIITGWPMVINKTKALPARKDFQDIQIGDPIEKVRQIDGVTAPYERQIFDFFNMTKPIPYTETFKKQGPLATYHYCKDGILRIEYADDPAQEGLNFIVAGFTFYEDFVVENYDGAKVNQKILDIDLPVK